MSFGCCFYVLKQIKEAVAMISIENASVEKQGCNSESPLLDDFAQS